MLKSIKTRYNLNKQLGIRSSIATLKTIKEVAPYPIEVSIKLVIPILVIYFTGIFNLYVSVSNSIETYAILAVTYFIYVGILFCAHSLLRYVIHKYKN